VKLKTAAAVMVTVAAVAMSGCTTDRDKPDPTASKAIPPASPPTSGSTPVLRAAPAAREGYETLSTIPPRTGGYTTTVSARKGKIVVLLNCLNGSLVIKLEGVAEMPFACSASEVIPYGSEIELVAAQQVAIQITPADPQVTWTVTVLQAQV
jgi:hypothetical protein